MSHRCSQEGAGKFDSILTDASNFWSAAVTGVEENTTLSGANIKACSGDRSEKNDSSILAFFLTSVLIRLKFNILMGVEQAVSFKKTDNHFLLEDIII